MPQILRIQASSTVHDVNDGLYRSILPIIQVYNKRMWLEYIIPLASEDDLVMTAIALLYSSHMNGTGTGESAELYHDHFKHLWSTRARNNVLSADENHATLVALLILLLSAIGGPDSHFVLAEAMLLRCMLADIPAPMTQTAEEEHAAIKQWVRDEMDLMKKIREDPSYRFQSPSVSDRMDES
ncbi:hypothetical protein FGLOB1_11353 [Fusarium globosum]|uniref:Uncharacterized protein n=1 Tax=Fusarium globosum TaxID=78864 RepID=A0A8H5XSX8_9HYPO|nr:hypothetical protein FGLOB1_11353 [Fusarium globosum]